MSATITFSDIDDSEIFNFDRAIIQDARSGEIIKLANSLTLNADGTTQEIDLTGTKAVDGQELQLLVTQYDDAQGYVLVARGSAVVSDRNEVKTFFNKSLGGELNPQNYDFQANEKLRIRTAVYTNDGDTAILAYKADNTQRIEIINPTSSTPQLRVDDGTSEQLLDLNGHYQHGALQTWEVDFGAGGLNPTFSIDGSVVGTLTLATQFSCQRGLSGAPFIFDYIEYLDASDELIFRAQTPSTKTATTNLYNVVNTLGNFEAVVPGLVVKMRKNGDYYQELEMPQGVEVAHSYGASAVDRTPPDSAYTLIIITGQSLGNGTSSASNLQVNRSVIDNAFYVQGGSLAPFAGDKERAEVSFMDEYQSKTGENLIRMNIARSSTALSGLERGSANYDAFLTELGELNTALTGNQVIDKVIIAHIHGENDSNTGADTYYADGVVQYRDDIASDIRTYWPGIPVKMFVSQLGNTMIADLAGRRTMMRVMADMNDPANDMFVCAPRHYLNYLYPSVPEQDEVHLHPIGYLELGCDIAMAVITEHESGSWEPLRITSATYNGDTIVATTNATSPIRFDPLIPYIPSGGFMLLTGGEYISATTAEITGDNEITITMPQAVTASDYLITGDHGYEEAKEVVLPIIDSSDFSLPRRSNLRNKRLLADRISLTQA